MRLQPKALSLIATTCVLCALAFWRWKLDEPRRTAAAYLAQFDLALQSNDGSALQNLVVTPAAIRDRAETEKVQFLQKALADEISDSGVTALKRNGRFGPLQDIFPAEGAQWATQAGVTAEDCVAFRMERAGIRAEFVLVHEGQYYRVARCNNVKQMAGVH